MGVIDPCQYKIYRDFTVSEFLFSQGMWEQVLNLGSYSQRPFQNSTIPNYFTQLTVLDSSRHFSTHSHLFMFCFAAFHSPILSSSSSKNLCKGSKKSQCHGPQKSTRNLPEIHRCQVKTQGDEASFLQHEEM